MNYRNIVLAAAATGILVFLLATAPRQSTAPMVEVAPVIPTAAAPTSALPTDSQIVELVWFDQASGKSMISYGRWDGGLQVQPFHDLYEDAVQGSSYDYLGQGFGIRADVNGHLELQLAYVAKDKIMDGQRIFTLYPTTTAVVVRESESIGQALTRASKAHRAAELDKEAAARKAAKNKK